MTLKQDFLKEQNFSINNSELISIEDFISGVTKERLLLAELQNIANNYIELERRKRNFARLILKNIDLLDFSNFIENPNYLIKEKFLKKSVFPANLKGLNVVCVDGSSVVKKFMDVDFSFLKAIAVKYYFRKSHDATIRFFPDLGGYNNYSIKGNYKNKEEQVVEASTSIEMTYMEINLLNRLIENQSDIDFVIIDGSIMNSPLNAYLSQDLDLISKYHRLVKEYMRLYEKCKEKNILLIGSIKDTRNSILTNLLRDSIMLLKPNYSYLKEFLDINYRQIMEYFSDLDLFNRILNKSERSCVFKCERQSSNNSERNNFYNSDLLNELNLSFYAFYLKTAKYDTPCRIEFFIDKESKNKDISEKADVISALLLPISSLNEYYGLPIPQIEAHKRAVFNQEELSLLFNNLTRILLKNGIVLTLKRRNRRPF
ncbi:MAG: DNA double-strand break repair nuclease NurA [Promethearchaeota archaeon]